MLDTTTDTAVCLEIWYTLHKAPCATIPFVHFKIRQTINMHFSPFLPVKYISDYWREHSTELHIKVADLSFKKNVRILW